MTDQEIDKWVEEHLEFRGNWPENSIEKQNIINGMKHIILKFHELCKEEKSEKPINLTWQDIKKIVNIADAMLDDPKMRIAIQNHSEEEYYQKVLKAFNLCNVTIRSHNNPGTIPSA